MPLGFIFIDLKKKKTEHEGQYLELNPNNVSKANNKSRIIIQKGV